MILEEQLICSDLLDIRTEVYQSTLTSLIITISIVIIITITIIISILQIVVKQ